MVVLVRSILLRGFDRDCVDAVHQAMAAIPNLRIVASCLPTKIEKLPSGKLLVSFSSGGRYAVLTTLNSNRIHSLI